MIISALTVYMEVETTHAEVPMTISDDSVELEMAVGAEYRIVEGERYDGSYEVTPRLYAQSLDTDGKLMEDDVTVYEIPISRAANPTGGLTVLIG